TTGVIFGAVYLLIMYQKVFFGKLEHDENKVLSDLTVREWGQLAVLSIAALFIGLFPNVLLKPINHSTASILHAVSEPLDFVPKEMEAESAPQHAEEHAAVDVASPDA